MIRNTVCQQEIIRKVYLKFETTFKDLYDVLINKGFDACFCIQIVSVFDESIDFYLICVPDSIWLKPGDLKSKNKESKKTLEAIYIPIATLDCFCSNGVDFTSPSKLLFTNREYSTDHLSSMSYQQQIEECKDMVFTFETVLYFDTNDNLIKQESVIPKL